MSRKDSKRNSMLSLGQDSISGAKKGILNRLLKRHNSPHNGSDSARSKHLMSGTSTGSGNSDTLESSEKSEVMINSDMSSTNSSTKSVKSTTAVPTKKQNHLDAKKLTRNQSVKSSKSVGGDYIDRDDATIFNSEEDETHAADHIESDISDNSETSSVYSSLQRTGSMSIIDHTQSSLDNSNVTIVDQRLNDLLNKPNYPDSTPWEGFKREALTVPKYLRVNRRNKNSPQVLKRLFLAQELNNTLEDELDHNSRSEDSDAFTDKSGDTSSSRKKANHVVGDNMGKEIFIMEFSRDGKYLAVAGRGSVIKIFKVISSPLGRLEYDNYHESHDRTKKKHKADEVYPHSPVFHQTPVRVFRGHKSSVLSLDWSKNNFLVSGSMDKTVKLWHVDRPDYLSSFRHEDFVTTVKFHPNDDRFFFSGSLDNQARIWSILENSVAFGKHLGDDMLITSSSFTPDGFYCLVGGFNGTLLLLETKGLHIVNRFEIKPRHLVPLSNTSGNKITNIKVFANGTEYEQPIADDDYATKWTYLITTNDSKIRLVNIKKKKLMTRFKGSTNTSSIEASMSEDGNLILCGSEDHWCYIWENNNSIINNKLKVALQDMIIEGKHHINDLQHKHKHYHDFLSKNKLFKKLNLQQILKDDSNDFISNENSSYASFHAHHSSVNAAVFAPNATKKLLELSDDLIFDLLKRGRQCQKLEEYSSFELPSEDSVENGNSGFIIVTTDETGLIRVFRQDPAYEIRKTILDLYKKEGYDKPPDCKIMSQRMHSKSLSPQPNIKNKIHTKLRSNDTATLASDTPNSSNSLPGSISKPSPPKSLNQNLNHSISLSTPSLLLGSSSSQRPHLKSMSNGILDSNHATVQIKSDSMKEREISLNALNRQLPNIDSNSGSITPEKEITTPFPMLKSKSTQNSVPLIVNTDHTNEKKSEIVNFTTPINKTPRDDILGRSEIDTNG